MTPRDMRGPFEDPSACGTIREITDNAHGRLQWGVTDRSQIPWPTNRGFAWKRKASRQAIDDFTDRCGLIRMMPRPEHVARRHGVQGGYDKAIAVTTSLRLATKETAFYSNRAKSLESPCVYEKAVEDCTAALETIRNWRRLYVTEGMLGSTGRVDKASTTPMQQWLDSTLAPLTMSTENTRGSRRTNYDPREFADYNEAVAARLDDIDRCFGRPRLLSRTGDYGQGHRGPSTKSSNADPKKRSSPLPTEAICVERKKANCQKAHRRLQAKNVAHRPKGTSSSSDPAVATMDCGGRNNDKAREDFDAVISGSMRRKE